MQHYLVKDVILNVFVYPSERKKEGYPSFFSCQKNNDEDHEGKNIADAEEDGIESEREVVERLASFFDMRMIEEKAGNQKDNLIVVSE